MSHVVQCTECDVGRMLSPTGARDTWRLKVDSALSLRGNAIEAFSQDDVIINGWHAHEAGWIVRHDEVTGAVHVKSGHRLPGHRTVIGV